MLMCCTVKTQQGTLEQLNACVYRMVTQSKHVLKSEGKIDLHLVTDCRHKPRPLHVKEWDVSQTIKSNCTSNKCFPKMVFISLGSSYGDDVCSSVYFSNECAFNQLFDTIKSECGVIVILRLGLLVCGHVHHCTALTRLQVTSLVHNDSGHTGMFGFIFLLWKELETYHHDCFYSLWFTQKNIQTECN